MNGNDPEEVILKKNDYSDDQNDHTETPEFELCPECQTPLKMSTVTNGPDDFDTIAQCEGCGYTESS